MLSIGVVSIGGERYYAKLANANYYTAGGEPPGRWWGQAAESLHLQGEVSAEDFSMLALGFSPSGRRPLVRNAGSTLRRAGFDLTFSAPKSVSVFWSQSDAATRAAIEQAQHKAVTAALTYLEQEAARSRRGAGGAEHVQAKLVAALFPHCTARAQMGFAPDPQLHTHAVVMNLGLGEDGRWSTLDGRQLFIQKMTAGALYRAELFKGLRQELGLVACQVEGGVSELADVPQAVVRAFSKRRAAMEAVLYERGETGALASQRAALSTRKTKAEVSRQELFDEWRRQAQTLSFTPEQVRRELSQEVDHTDLLGASVRRSLQEITDKQAHFPKRDLLRAVAEQVEHVGVAASEIRQAVDSAVQNLVPLQERRGERQFTTRAMLFAERSLFQDAKALMARRHVASCQEFEVSPTTRLTEEQRTALAHVTEGRALSLVSGLAGTGKTSLLREARRSYEACGYKVIGAALAAQAARGLEEGSGIESKSLHATLRDIERGSLVLDRNTVVVIDEASMVGTKLLGRFMREAERTNAKLVLVGDERQLQAIEAGTPFEALLERHGGSHLEQVQRQSAEWAREVTLQFARGEVRKALEEFDRRGLVHVGKDTAQVLGKMTADWKEAVRLSGIEQTLVVTSTRADARVASAQIQAERMRSGELEGEAVETAHEVMFVGDRVRFRRNTSEVLNGEMGVVTAACPERGCLTVELDSGRCVDLNLQEYPHVELGYAGTTHSAQGATVERCLVLCSEKMQGQEMSYVQASRAREETRFYVDRKAAGPQLEDLIRSMERSSELGMAIDLLPVSS